MKLVAIIPARGGSTRIPRKNIRKFHHSPIIGYSIQTAIDSALFHAIVVSTDDDEIADFSTKMGVTAICRRGPDLARDDVGTQEVTRDAIHSMEKNGNVFDIACCIYPTAPLMSPIDLACGLATLHESRAPFCYSTDGLGTDAGQFYWGFTWAFRGRIPLDRGVRYLVGAERVCDINVEADWLRAEKMFLALHGAP